MNSESLELAYVLNCYPKLSETFVQREVRGLRARGIGVAIASLNEPDRSLSDLSESDRDECAATFYVKRQGPWRAVAAFLSESLRRPRGVARALSRAVGLAKRNPERLVVLLLQVVEAVLVARWLRTTKARHVHAHFGSAASTVAMLVADIAGVGFSFTFHGPDELYEVERHHLREKIAAASFVSCIGRFARSQMMRLSAAREWAKLEVCRLGVDPDRFAPVPRQPDSPAFEVLCVGRLVDAKGQHILIEAARSLRATGRTVRVRFVGDGPDRAALEEAVQRHRLQNEIVFAGAVPQERIRHEYAAADVFCLPSFAEGIPVVLMEAMAMEIPVVSTCITGIPELIRDGIDGRLVAPSDAVELAEALAELMDFPETRERLGRAGRTRVAELFHLDRNLDVFAAMLRRRLRAKARSTAEPVGATVAAVARGTV